MSDWHRNPQSRHQRWNVFLDGQHLSPSADFDGAARSPVLASEMGKEGKAERLSRGKHPLPMLGQQRFDLVQQFRTRQHIEKSIRIVARGSAPNTSLLIRSRSSFSIYMGWFMASPRSELET